MLVVARGFELDAKLNARVEGVPDLSLAMFPLSAVPTPKEIEGLALGEKVAAEVAEALTRRLPRVSEAKEAADQQVPVFRGGDYAEALNNMDKYFLQQGWSDGFPLVPPTEAAVSEMLEGTELPREHVVGFVEPEGGKATVEKIAINAVMAGCLPQYLPVIIAAVEALTDPMSDLRGVQCTTGPVSPLLVISGTKLIEELNVNDSFSTIGPGWRANSTIGRAIRLMMINLGHCWPGNPDMKAFGNPFKFVTLMAENEAAYTGAWEPIRVAEGFADNQPTISVMPAVSFRVALAKRETATADEIVAVLSREGKAKYDRRATQWGLDNLIILSPMVFEIFRNERRSRADVQKALYEQTQLPCREFFLGQEPSSEIGVKPIPQWLIDKCKANPDASAPLFAKPENIKIIVAGGAGPAIFAYVDTWGFGPAHFLTKAIKLPRNWKSLLAKHRGWESPTVRNMPYSAGS